MRKEIEEYIEQHPYSKYKLFMLKIKEFTCLKLFLFKIKKMKVGSPKWHVLQEKISRKSAVGLDIKIRNLFYEKTLPVCGKKIYVHPGIYFCYPQNISIGYNLFINRDVFIVAPEKITIGDNVLIGPSVMINSGSHYYKDASKLIRNQGHKLLPIIIEDDVWIGAHVTILPGVTLGKGSVVGAGAVVTKSVEPYAVVAGVPAKVITKRNS